MIKIKRVVIILLILIAILTLMQITVFSQEEGSVSIAKIGFVMQLEDSSGIKSANLTLIEHTQTCLTDCKSIVDFVPIRDFDYDFNTIVKYYTNGVMSNGFESLTYKFYKKVNKTRSSVLQIANCSIIIHENSSSSEQCTFSNDGYTTETYVEYVEEPFSGLKNFIQGESYRIIVELRRKPRLGPNYIDWGLSFNGTEVPWAWFGSEFPYRIAIKINNSGNEILRKYHTIEVSGLNTTDGTRWNLTNPNSFAVICNETEVDKVIGNRTDLTSAYQTLYYPESTGWGTSNTTFLFRLRENISANSINNTMCYIYYGNTTYNSTSNNISGIVLLYDDFNRPDSPILGNNWNETNESEWEIRKGSIYRANISGSKTWRDLDVGRIHDAEKYVIMSSQNPLNSAGPNENGHKFNFNNAPQNHSTNVAGFQFHDQNREGNNYPDVGNASGVEVKASNFQWSNNVNYSMMTIAFDDRNRGDFVGYLQGLKVAYNHTNNTNPFSESGGNKKGVDINGRMPSGQLIHYIFIRRYIDIDPTITFGSEESFNLAPNTPDLTYNVSVAYNFTNLNCSSVTGISDPNGDNMTVFFNLTIDSLHKEEYILTNQPNGSRPSWQIDHHNYSKGQTVRCNITLFDGSLYSVTNSTIITISNSVPFVENLNSTSLNRTLNYTTANVTYQENETIRFSINISDQDTSDTQWYSWFVNDVLRELSQNRFFEWASGFFSDGLNIVKVVINDSSNENVTKQWNVTILNVVNRFFIINFISPPTLANGSILDSTTVNISVQIIPTTIQSAAKTFTDDTEAEFNLGNYANVSFNTSVSAVVLNKTGLLEQIFFDGFESGNLNGWSVTGAGNVWSAIQAHPFEGAWSAKVNNTGNVNPTNMTRNISTLGFTGINITYYRQIIEMEPSDEFYAEYYNGTSFIILELNNTVANDASYVLKSFNLGTDINENPNFRIRFLCKNNMAVEQCRLDNVKVNGLRQVFLKNGVFTSQIFNGTEQLIWDNISWGRTLPSGTNLTFQARSCDDSACSGESFIGPDGTANTSYTNNLGQNLNVSNNTYLQYKTFFETTNINVTSQLSSVTIKGHTIVSPSPTVEINSTIINFNGTNITMNGSGFFWSYVNTTLRPGNYSYIVYANDSFNNINLTEKRTFSVPSYNITFNVTFGEDGTQINNLDKITCNYTGFNRNDDPTPNTNPYGPYAFPPGNWECTFEEPNVYNKTVGFTADSFKIVPVIMEEEKSLTNQEHDWLKAIYDCLHSGNCDIYTLVNKTYLNVSKIWLQYLPTDKSVLVQETFISNLSSPISNITINYTINIPLKEGFNDKELLPLRIFYWFTDTNGKCYNQDKQTNSNKAETPFCIPLMAEYLGPNNGSISFKVDLHPNLSSGTYQVVRSIDIDPPLNGKPVWINYGREAIGKISVIEGTLSTIGDDGNEETSITAKSPLFTTNNGITGNMIEALNPIHGGLNKLLLALAMVCITIITTSYLKYRR